MIRSGSAPLSFLASPRWATKRSSAFSRIEQVLKRIRSASAASAASAYPSDSSMPFMRSESCSFIWHPKVVTWKRFPAIADTKRRAISSTVPFVLLAQGPPQRLGNDASARLKFGGGRKPGASGPSGDRVLLLDDDPAFELSYWCGT